MDSIERTLEPLTPDLLASRIRSLACSIAGEVGVDDLEMRHLLEILTRSSLLLTEGYDSGMLDRILSHEPRLASLLEPMKFGGAPQEERLMRVLNLPDALRTCGDKCLYDVGLAGRTTFRGVDLQDLGPRSYSLASRVLTLLADDRRLRDFYDRNLLERLPLAEEILFLKQCASRFQVHAQILQAFRAHDAEPAAQSAAGLSVGPAATSPRVPEEGIVLLRTTSANQAAERSSATAGLAPRDGAAGMEEELRGLGRDDRLARYERQLLFSTLDVRHLREEIKRVIVDQDEAVDQVCDDLSVFAMGTRGRPRPQCYLMVGPTGVGKNYLIETVVGLLEEAWGVEVPFLILEGPQYAHPADVTELKGSTRGFIRSDEEGILFEFHERARLAPLSILLVDEVEKAHPQLPRFFLSLMDRGSTLDNKGRLLRFPATILVYTSNLGYSEEQQRTQPIGYGARRTANGRRRAAARDLGKALAPEFLNRLRVIHFAPLSRVSARRILDQEIEQIVQRYRARHDIDLVVTQAARAALVDLGFSEEYGARHLVSQADRVCNVEVSLRIHAGSPSPGNEGRRLLARIRDARRGLRAIDEASLRHEVARQTRAGAGCRRITVDWKGGRFVYPVEMR
ncbi:MAG TPA: AAA family ATPase [Candidatus Polarisedimenticolia bacterium]|nr:AAA family ATPase [Candidatus Polarisedimenticolia bacterium]